MRAMLILLLLCYYHSTAATNTSNAVRQHRRYHSVPCRCAQ
jgi:hypothetical protein